MSKKKNKRYTQHRIRRALNTAIDFFINASYSKVINFGYHRGIGSRNIREKLIGDHE